MVEIKTAQFSPKRLREIRRLGCQSLHYFNTAILGHTQMTPGLHRETNDWLQNDRHPKKLLCQFRGSFKSSELRALALWAGLNCLDEEWPWKDWMGLGDFNWLWIEQKWDNAVAHHRLLQGYFKRGPRAEILCEMYADRLPFRLQGWTDSQTLLNRHDPTSEPFLSVGSLDSRLEGLHRRGIICDDLEGADAEKGDAPNEASWNFVENRAEDLLLEPARALLVVAGTPHGPNPVVWRIREMEGGGTLDNSKRKLWHVCWTPIVDEAGKPQFPERYPAELVERRRLAAEMSLPAKRRHDTQDMLRKSTGGVGRFDIDKLRSNFWDLLSVPVLAPGMRHRQIVWKYNTLELPERTEGIEFKLEVKPARVNPGACRAYLHWDPAHKTREQMKSSMTEYTPAKHALVAILYSPDCHVLVADAWIAEAKSDVALEQFFRMYRRWVPYEWTLETFGAQGLFLDLVTMMERNKYRRLTSMPCPWRPKPRLIPRPSTRMVEVNRKAGRDALEKEEHIENGLQWLVDGGYLHLHKSQLPLIHEFETFGSEQGTWDGLEALVQGVGRWQAPPSEESLLAAAKQAAFRKFLEGSTLYETPWSTLTQNVTRGQNLSPA